MRIILKYIFSILFVIAFCYHPNAQVKKSKTKGFKLGFDASRAIISFLKDDRTSFSVTMDYQLKKRFFFVADAGYEALTYINTDSDNNELINYEGQGCFGRFGIDYNLFDEGNDIMLVGFRTGYSIFNHDLKNISIVDDNWGNYTSNDFSAKTLNALWIEGVYGFRVELFKNFYMGYTIHLNLFLTGKEDEIMPPYRIPGFGKGEKKFTITADYMMYYRVPF